MCVQSSIFSRASFLAPAGAAAAAGSAVASQGAPPFPSLPSGLSKGNARAAAIAHASPLAQRNWHLALQLAQSIGDARMRADVLDLLQQPATKYARRYTSAQARSDLRDTLVREGLLKADVPIAGIFPHGVDGSGARSRDYRRR